LYCHFSRNAVLDRPENVPVFKIKGGEVHGLIAIGALYAMAAILIGLSQIVRRLRRMRFHSRFNTTMTALYIAAVAAMLALGT
jgi:hypothetical protein